MSELFDEEARGGVRPAPRRSRALLVTALVVVLLFFALSTFASVYTDRLWYRDIGYGGVFTRMLWTRVGLFGAFGLLMAGLVALNIVLAYRFRPLFRPSSPEQSSLDRYREAVTPLRTWLVVGVAGVLGVFAGASGMGQWRTYLLWRNAQPFGTEDAYFGKDLGFFVFSLPWWHYLVGFAMTAAVIAAVAAGVVHYLYGGIRLQAPRDRLSDAAQVQLSVLLGVLVLFKAVDYYLDRFQLVNDQHTLFTGMNNTGENAVLPAKNILLGVAVICAVLLFANAWRRTWQLPSIGLALLVLSSILLGLIWPAIVQQFQVNPSEADKERPYIGVNIEATRAAYGLENVEVSTYDTNAAVTGTQAASLGRQTSQVPVIDPKLVRETFEQRQQARKYYSVAGVLDVDRYQLGDRQRPLVLGVRELDQSGIDPSDQNWSNLRTVYTHGSGIIAAYADEVPRGQSGDRIAWAEGIESGQDALSTLDKGYEPRIYFGEKSPDYSIVGKAGPGDPSVELELAGLNAEEDATTTYDGAGGIPVGGFFNQLMYAVKFGDPNFLLSGRVNANSEVLYNRTPRERVEKVAPWLTIDSDPYPAVVGGRVLWILDGYTTTDRYPNSQRESFDAMTDDSLQQDAGLRTVPTDEINYMRNAVKATVDAYDGTVTLYAWDETDPILRAWQGAFPGIVKPKSEIPAELLPHLRYPEDLFKVQRYQLARYHVTDPTDFYQGNNRWEVPEDPNSRSYQPPYRVFTNPDGNANGPSTWALTSVFVPRGKGNLASFVAVNSDATSPDYGRINVLELADANTPGPGLVANEMSQDDKVVAELQDFRVQGAPPPIFGNLLTLPVDDGLVYVEPVYAVRSATSSFPILQYVIVSYGGQVGIGPTLTDAIADVLDVGAPPRGTPPATNPPPKNPPGQAGGTVDQRVYAYLQQADRLFAQADRAKSRGDFTIYLKLVAQAQEKIRQAVSLANSRR